MAEHFTKVVSVFCVLIWAFWGVNSSPASHRALKVNGSPHGAHRQSEESLHLAEPYTMTNWFNKRFGTGVHNNGILYNSDFDQVKSRTKREVVLDGPQPVWIALSGLGGLLLLCGIALVCWYSRTCCVERRPDGTLPPPSVTGAGMFRVTPGYENLGFAMKDELKSNEVTHGNTHTR